MKKYIVAYDIGSTRLKSCLFTWDEHNLELVKSCINTYKLYSFNDGYIEQDLEEIWKAFCDSTNDLVFDYELSKDNTLGISLCCQGNDVVLLDENREPLRRLISNLDSRGIETLNQNVFKILRTIKTTNGAPVSEKDNLWKYLWVKKHEPEVYAKTKYYLDLKNYINYKLTGKIKRVVDDAQLTFLYDVKHHHWDSRLIDLYGVNKEHLPEVIGSKDVVGELCTQEVNLPLGVPVFGGGNDISLTNLGCGAVKNGDVNIYLGTNGWISVTLDRYCFDVVNKLATLSAYDMKRYNFMAFSTAAGKSMEWVILKLINKSFSDINKVMNMEPCSNGVMFFPWIRGLRSPVQNDTLRGTFIGLTEATTDLEIIRSVIEGNCQQLYWLYDTCKSKISPNGDVYFCGGGAESTVTCGILADMLNREIKIPKDYVDVGATGAAF